MRVPVVSTVHSRRPRAAVRTALGAVLAAVLWLAPAAAREGQAPQARAAAPPVLLDVYVSRDGAAVTDLTAGDFEVLEDNVLQTLSAVTLVPARAAAGSAPRVDPASAPGTPTGGGRPDVRDFVLFLDTRHLPHAGPYRESNRVAPMLDRVIGLDDPVGVMTPEMTARNMLPSPRTGPVGDLLRANGAWGDPGRASASEPREEELRECFPDPSIAAPLIRKRREQQTLRALGDLIDHLDVAGGRRTFVFVLTTGWRLPRPDEGLARPLSEAATASCERERGLVALADLDGEFRLLLQRANRANVSFYPIDALELAAPEADAAEDAATLAARRDSLRTLAAETDGDVVLETAADRALARLLTDTGAYYLLTYTPTNTKPDGRYRRLTVRVGRPGVTVRARAGYLAPTAREAARDDTAAATTAGVSGTATSRVSDALSRLPVARRPPVAYLDATAGAGLVTAVVEIDRVAASGDWAKGGLVRLALTSAERASALRAVAEATLAPGARVHVARLPDGPPLPPGRYQVRLEALPAGGRSPVVVTTLVDVPGEGALLGSALLASRRGPGTGRAFVPTADARFRRTERLRLEVPRLATDGSISARLLNRGGQPMQVPVEVSERPPAEGAPALVVAEAALAPLAPGEYVIEITATRGGSAESRTYALRLVP